MDDAYDTHRPPPAFAYVTPRDARSNSVTYQGENVDKRLVAMVVPQSAPDPLRQSEFTMQGKPWETAAARIQVATYFNIAGRQAVMEDFFLSGKEPITLAAKTPRGGQLPFRTRSNIDRPSAQPYGDQASVPGLATQYGMVTQGGLSYQLSAQ